MLICIAIIWACMSCMAFWACTSSGGGPGRIPILRSSTISLISSSANRFPMFCTSMLCIMVCVLSPPPRQSWKSIIFFVELFMFRKLFSLTVKWRLLASFRALSS